MAVSPEIQTPASELSLGVLRRVAQEALDKNSSGVDLDYRVDRARENLATVEKILRIPEIGTFLSRSHRQVNLLRINSRNPSGKKHRYLLYTEGTQVVLQKDYHSLEEGGWSTFYASEIKPDNFPHDEIDDTIVRSLSELSVADIVKKFQRALSRRPF